MAHWRLSQRDRAYKQGAPSIHNVYSLKMCLHAAVLFVLFLLYAQQCASQVINLDDGIVFDDYGKKRLVLPMDAKNGKTKSVAVQDKMDCIFACFNAPRCSSVNFQTAPLSNGLHLCELLSLDQSNSSKYLTENKEFLHYTLKVICDSIICFLLLYISAVVLYK